MATYQEAYADALEYYNGDDLPAKTFIDKYALRDVEGVFEETTPIQMHRRLAGELHRIEKKYPNPRSYDEIFEAVEDFRYFVPQGSPMYGIGNPHALVSLSNCFVVQSPEDDMSAIVEQGKDLANIMKRRGGVGIDISPLRPEGSIVNNAARTSTGAWSFADLYSFICRMIGQDGRRGALMISIDVRHPDVFKFATMKRDLKKVTGANVSIRLTDNFMRAVRDDKNFTLQWPVKSKTPEVKEVIRARDLWDVIVESVHGSAEPGLLMWDSILRELPAQRYADVGFNTVSTNPCITGDTLIAVADGRNAVPVAQLAEEGVDIPVYSTDPRTGQVQIKWGRDPRLTKRSTEVWRLTLDDGSSLKATPDHKIMLRGGTYKELSSLVPGESVFPFYSFDYNGYRQISNSGAGMLGSARRNRRQYRLMYEFYNGAVDPKEYAIHHVDFDLTNDRIANLSAMPHAEHRGLHASRMRGPSNPYHKMSDAWKRSFTSHPGERNPRYIAVTNEQLLEHGCRCLEDAGKLTKRSWVKYAKSKGLPQYLSSSFRFGSFSEFRNLVINNHKVAAVEFVGYEDVYNITVDDNHNYHVITSAGDFRYIRSSGVCVKNCGEIPLSPEDACRLLAMNLTGFVVDPFGPGAKFDFDLFQDKVGLAQRMMDNIVDLELECVQKIIDKAADGPERRLWEKIYKRGHDGRRTGLGTFGLADTLAQLKLRYDSDGALEVVDRIYKTLRNSSYAESITMAEERGAFPVWDWEKEKNCPFIKRLPAALKRRAAEVGRRNIANLTNAPTGSTSICSFNVSSGIEPVFRCVYTRRKKLTHNDENSRIDFIDALGDKWQEFKVFHSNVARWLRMNDPEWDGKALPELPSFFVSSDEIDWTKRVRLQGVVQRYIDHSISSTINLPAGTPLKTINELYLRSWEEGLKGVTIYVDGSRSGVLVTNTKDKDGRPTQVTRTQAPRRPNTMPCDIYHGRVHGEPWTILVGLLNRDPYELFGGPSAEAGIPKSIKSGYLEKTKVNKSTNCYNLSYSYYNDTAVVENVGNLFENKTYGTFTRVLSLALRHGTPVQHIVEQLGKDKSEELNSLSNVLARALKKYIANGTVVTGMKEGCTRCGSNNIRYQEGCPVCLDCGFTKCK